MSIHEDVSYPSYEPNFLGDDHGIALPTGPVDVVQANLTHFSVLYRKDKKIAWLCAANINRALQKSKNRKKEDYYEKDDITKDDQYNNNWYYGGPGGSGDLYDKGHMARRETVRWGSTDAEAHQAEDDSFYWINIAPHHQGVHHDEWKIVEDAILKLIDQDAEGTKATVMTGSHFGSPPNPLDNMWGSPNDPATREIPTAFFKLLFYVDKNDHELKGLCFWVPHTPITWTTEQTAGQPERIKGTPAQFFLIDKATLQVRMGLQGINDWPKFNMLPGGATL
uniref:Endonuclease n=1 Tax=Paramoeba aestuarina TaxID=180227 RepID=A0A7S4PLG5_9EUKA|mmetsp:Transcript_8487/g.12843  ORF Transcript_8487/g.12843 Transcript_8487/m.12843 type:complete len:280 (+) Transcript_8487:78-917(+)|eukprot:CAMPEP_0201521292 /NCGR_PEP_ID=MMETSP0161_2-20130828/14335_1 /ASSEMBLY_ACC=CAM_ASM_000251 /TAXON_ID=180227 /ORGANISM="Neoparamoeba aestuarina, Strain SoJaBio B1-5/56/2" /LENGTH=279 /DNA_ID=CAMNT_0047919905 /DNA_START=60 /DNA_END=899 /DNA_ORIENTATION=+